MESHCCMFKDSKARHIVFGDLGFAGGFQKLKLGTFFFHVVSLFLQKKTLFLLYNEIKRRHTFATDIL